LDRTQVTTALKHVGGVGVAQRVWTVLLESYGLQASVKGAADTGGIEPFAADRQQEGRWGIHGRDLWSTAGEPSGDGIGGWVANWHEARLATLAGHAQGATLETREVERAGLSRAQSAAIEQFEQRAVTKSDWSIGPGDVEHVRGVASGRDGWQATRTLWARNLGGGIGLAFARQAAMKATNGGQATRAR
jgi:hypothetical protein